MPGFFDIIFGQPEPEPEAPKPKKAKKGEKPDKGEKAKPFVHPLKTENARLKAELESLRQPEPEVKETKSVRGSMKDIKGED